MARTKRKVSKGSQKNKSQSTTPSSAPSTPATSPDITLDEEEIEDEIKLGAEDQKAYDEEQKVKEANEQARTKAVTTRKPNQFRDVDREVKAKALEKLLAKCEQYSGILKSKTLILGRIGSGAGNQSLGTYDASILKPQPRLVVGGTLKDYQLAGMTWAYEIMSLGSSGILADEMGLGKTVQTISTIAALRETEGYYGPFMIIVPLSTLSNWEDEFNRWAPSIPVVKYHGNATVRKAALSPILKLYRRTNGRPNSQFPVCLTTPEMVMKDLAGLKRISWEVLIIDEGHRLKNNNSRFYQDLQQLPSLSRCLLTGTPLQNNLKELWSLLSFLLPSVFTDWDLFEAYFDFQDYEDENKAKEFLEERANQDLIAKVHTILAPMLLRRIKGDVEHLLPQKREYILYAPMSEEQRDLQHAMLKQDEDTMTFLKTKVAEKLRTALKAEAHEKAEVTRLARAKKESRETKLPIRKRGRPAKIQEIAPQKNAFELIMRAKSSTATTGGKKRKSSGMSTPTSVKSVKSSRQSTPATRGTKNTYAEDNSSDDDALSDDDFERKLAEEYAEKEEEVPEETEDEAFERKIQDLTVKALSRTKLLNPMMQLRKIANSPHLFYDLFHPETGLKTDESIVNESGKMRLLDRLLPALFAKGHRVLIFSQFSIQLDLIEDYARELRGWDLRRIDGSIATDQRRQYIADFNSNPDLKLFLLTTRAGGQGINLAAADTVILFDSDWNPQQDLQAQDRVHRIGQTKPVIIYRFATRSGIETKLLSRADAKRRLEKLVIRKEGAIKKLDNQGLTEEEMNALLLKDAEIYNIKDNSQILSDEDLEVLMDRSDEAYNRAKQGLGDAARFKVIETKADGFMGELNKKESA